MRVKAIVVGVFASFCVLAASFAQEDNQELLKRIQPVGKVQLASDMPAERTGPRTGEEVYKVSCSACHTSGLLGAPKINSNADWQPRIDAKGFDTVWQNAIDGIGQMPAMGTCMDCDNDEIKAAIEYMIGEN